MLEPHRRVHKRKPAGSKYKPTLSHSVRMATVGFILCGILIGVGLMEHDVKGSAAGLVGGIGGLFTGLVVLSLVYLAVAAARAFAEELTPSEQGKIKTNILYAVLTVLAIGALSWKWLSGDVGSFFAAIPGTLGFTIKGLVGATPIGILVGFGGGIVVGIIFWVTGGPSNTKPTGLNTPPAGDAQHASNPTRLTAESKTATPVPSRPASQSSSRKTSDAASADENQAEEAGTDTHTPSPLPAHQTTTSSTSAAASSAQGQGTPVPPTTPTQPSRLPTLQSTTLSTAATRRTRHTRHTRSQGSPSGTPFDFNSPRLHASVGDGSLNAELSAAIITQEIVETSRQEDSSTKPYRPQPDPTGFEGRPRRRLGSMGASPVQQADGPSEQKSNSAESTPRTVERIQRAVQNCTQHPQWQVVQECVKLSTSTQEALRNFMQPKEPDGKKEALQSCLSFFLPEENVVELQQVKARVKSLRQLHARHNDRPDLQQDIKYIVCGVYQYYLANPADNNSAVVRSAYEGLYQQLSLPSSYDPTDRTAATPPNKRMQDVGSPSAYSAYGHVEEASTPGRGGDGGADYARLQQELAKNLAVAANVRGNSGADGMVVRPETQGRRPVAKVEGTPESVGLATKQRRPLAGVLASPASSVVSRGMQACASPPHRNTTHHDEASLLSCSSPSSLGVL